MNGPAASPEPRHVPVLPAEVLAYLAPEAGQTVVDATVGAGGHARLLAERLGPSGRLVGLDRDPAMIELAGARLAEVSGSCPVTLVQDNFDRLREVLDVQGRDFADG